MDDKNINLIVIDDTFDTEEKVISALRVSGYSARSSRVEDEEDLEIAIKAIDKRHLIKEDIDDIHKEVKILQQVDHANIINYFETYEDDRFVYLCMELCTGGELIDNKCKDKY